VAAEPPTRSDGAPRLDLATTTLDVGGGPLTFGALPDGTYALDDRVLDSEPALLRALLAEGRLAGLTEPMLLGGILAAVALYGITTPQVFERLRELAALRALDLARAVRDREG
jgi:hypothetical protein